MRPSSPISTGRIRVVDAPSTIKRSNFGWIRVSMVFALTLVRVDFVDAPVTDPADETQVAFQWGLEKQKERDWR
ncbi:hypothetical protein N7449_001439 [Penicillium cf. viridicatum]|uniref:Uncharacterized protein n=1 Tax=Penicillium cf. viridicatum TaxID=2972119 RepID=A0A9W9N6R3_9EURO|nr:hypothetical protein N7449_001439 [Penicillium cf. viridicatum]